MYTYTFEALFAILFLLLLDLRGIYAKQSRASSGEALFRTGLFQLYQIC